MKRFLRKYRRLLLFFLIIGLIIASIIMQKKYNNIICSQVVIKINNKKQVNLLSEKQILEIIYKDLNIKLLGIPFSDIDANEIEKKLNNLPTIKKAEVYRAENTKIVIEITQRKPILKVIQENNTSYYIDNEGIIIPDINLRPQYVPVVSGYIKTKIYFLKNKKISIFADNKVKNSLLKKLFLLIENIENNEKLNGLIDQYYIDQKQNIILIPKVGNFKIYFGQLKEELKKIKKLEAIFEQIIEKKGWNKYKSFNLDYKNQIVAQLN